MAETAIKIENLKKRYRLGSIGGGTLNKDLQSWWARKRGKEDPNTKIGEVIPESGDTFLALDGINLEVKKGEALGIIGTNGAGKSTLLKILSRVTAPTEGDIWIKGRVTSMLEVGTGFHGEMTGRENVYMNGAILGMSRKEVDLKMDEIIEFSECGKFIDTPVKRYSSGMYVKLAFAVAAHLDSDIMIMDEVLAVGDMKFQEKCLGKMGNAANTEGKTVLYVSHNMNTIRQLCTRCIVLNHGKVIFDGDVEDAIEVYMDHEKGELLSYYDLMETPRPSLDHGKKVRIETLEFLDKEKAAYESNERFRVKITWDMKQDIDIDNLHVYFTILHADSTVVGTITSNKIDKIKDSSRRYAILEYDLRNLVPGTYYFVPDLYSMNSWGKIHSYDHPLQKIYFEIKSGNEEYSNWNRKDWGSVHFNNMEVADSGENR